MLSFQETKMFSIFCHFVLFVSLSKLGNKGPSIQKQTDWLLALRKNNWETYGKIMNIISPEKDSEFLGKN